MSLILDFSKTIRVPVNWYGGIINRSLEHLATTTDSCASRRRAAVLAPLSSELGKSCQHRACCELMATMILPNLELIPCPTFVRTLPKWLESSSPTVGQWNKLEDREGGHLISPVRSSDPSYSLVGCFRPRLILASFPTVPAGSLCLPFT
jgi:hypothetical protein